MATEARFRLRSPNAIASFLDPLGITVNPTCKVAFTVMRMVNR